MICGGLGQDEMDKVWQGSKRERTGEKRGQRRLGRRRRERREGRREEVGRRREEERGRREGTEKESYMKFFHDVGSNEWFSLSAKKSCFY